MDKYNVERAVVQLRDAVVQALDSATTYSAECNENLFKDASVQALGHVGCVF